MADLHTAVNTAANTAVTTPPAPVWAARAAPTVSVVIPSFNHAPYLQECIDSVLAQQPAPLELIVVDDGSTDGSLDILRNYGERIQLLQQQGGRQARARNLGVARARGDLVAFLDSDDRYRPGRLAAAQQVFAAQPQATLVWSDFCTINAQGQPQHTVSWQAKGTDFARALIAGNPICNATVTLKRAALLALGGFDETLPRACDGAAWYQLAAQGHCFVHVPRPLVDYRSHAGNDSKGFAAMAVDRDRALRGAVAAYLQHGVLQAPDDLPWLRQAMLRQFAFGAAAQVQLLLGQGLVSRSRAAIYRALGSAAGLQGFAQLKALKDATGWWR